MKDKSLFDLENQFETDLISQVLTDEGIPFRVVLTQSNYWGLIMGEGAAMLGPYARLWGYVKDEERIGELLRQVRESLPVEE